MNAPPSVIVNGSAAMPHSRCRLNVPASSVGGGTGFQRRQPVVVKLTPSTAPRPTAAMPALSVPYCPVAHSPF